VTEEYNKKLQPVSGQRFGPAVYRIRNRSVNHSTMTFGITIIIIIIIVSVSSIFYGSGPVTCYYSELLLKLRISSAFGSTHWIGYQPDARPLSPQNPIHKDEDKHPYLEWDSNPRSQYQTGQDPRLTPRGHSDGSHNVFRIKLHDTVHKCVTYADVNTHVTVPM
jgi:hypothetical protein